MENGAAADDNDYKNIWIELMPGKKQRREGLESDRKSKSGLYFLEFCIYSAIPHHH